MTSVPINVHDPAAPENTMLQAAVAYGVWCFTRTHALGRERLLEIELRDLTDPGQYQLSIEEGD